MIGCHISKNAHGNLVNSIKVAIANGATALQFNYSSPNAAAAGKKFTSAEIVEINRLKTELGVYLVVHGKYLYNFCRDAAWQQDHLINEIKEIVF